MRAKATLSTRPGVALGFTLTAVVGIALTFPDSGRAFAGEVHRVVSVPKRGQI